MFAAVSGLVVLAGLGFMVWSLVEILRTDKQFPTGTFHSPAMFGRFHGREPVTARQQQWAFMPFRHSGDEPRWKSVYLDQDWFIDRPLSRYT
jgi:hypothetical protein